MEGEDYKSLEDFCSLVHQVMSTRARQAGDKSLVTGKTCPRLSRPYQTLN